jgi:hypothetical protein
MKKAQQILKTKIYTTTTTTKKNDLGKKTAIWPIPESHTIKSGELHHKIS